MNKILILAFLFCCKLSCLAQGNAITLPIPADHFFGRDSLSTLYINRIIIAGNKKTKEYIIRREMSVHMGDSLPAAELFRQLEISRQQIHNTTLFAEVRIDHQSISPDSIDLVVTVREKWYLYPTPQFQLVDRNINEWLVKYKGDLGRVNYGLKFVHYNLSGRRDQLRIYLINGYSRNIGASYSNPYSNSALTQGFSVGGGFSQSREIGYKTNYDNSIARYNNGQFIYNAWNINGGFSIRKAIKKRHNFIVSYTHINITDSLANKLNPHYFNDPSSQKGIIDLLYAFNYVDLDNVLYPNKGMSGSLTVLKRGTGWSGGINLFSVEGNIEKFIPLGQKWYTGIQLLGRIKLPFEQAYINQRALGYGQSYLRGQEYFTIDALAHVIAKINLKKEIANFKLKTFIKKKSLSRIPFRILAKTFSDFGYAYNKGQDVSRLNNKFLYTGGFGLDIITLWDIQLRLEYSFNQLGQNGLFLHNQSGF